MPMSEIKKAVPGPWTDKDGNVEGCRIETYDGEGGPIYNADGEEIGFATLYTAPCRECGEVQCFEVGILCLFCENEKEAA
jgi:hypothetical protein